MQGREASMFQVYDMPKTMLDVLGNSGSVSLHPLTMKCQHLDLPVPPSSDLFGEPLQWEGACFWLW